MNLKSFGKGSEKVIEKNFHYPYLHVNENDPNEELVEVDKLIITYFVESFSEEIISHGEQMLRQYLKILIPLRLSTLRGNAKIFI